MKITPPVSLELPMQILRLTFLELLNLDSIFFPKIKQLLVVLFDEINQLHTEEVMLQNSCIIAQIFRQVERITPLNQICFLSVLSILADHSLLRCHTQVIKLIITGCSRYEPRVLGPKVNLIKINKFELRKQVPLRR